MELHVRAVSARGLMDTQLFGTQDPFCKLMLADRTQRTRVHDNGDTTPQWDEKFSFPIVDPQLDQLKVEVKNKGFTSSKLIGECKLPVSMFLHGELVDQWYKLNNDLEDAGEIKLRIKVEKPQVSAEPQAYTQPTRGYSQQQAYPPQQPSGPPPHQAYPVQTPSYPHQQPGYPPQQPGYPPQQPGYPAQHGYPTQHQYGYPPQQHMHHHHSSDSGRGGGYHGDDDGEGMSSGAQMALGVGAGVVGGMVLDNVIDDVFDDDSD